MTASIYTFPTAELFVAARTYALRAYTDALLDMPQDLPFDAADGASMAATLADTGDMQISIILTDGEAAVMAACFTVAAEGDVDLTDADYDRINDALTAAEHAA